MCALHQTMINLSELFKYILIKTPLLLPLPSKPPETDPYRQGVTVYFGVTDSKLWPTKALLAFIPAIDSASGSPFKFANQQALTRDRVVAKAGLNPNIYAGHSFRIGAATVVHLKGIQNYTIMTLTRWKSNAYQRYVRVTQEHLAHISTHIAILQPHSLT